MEHAQSPGMGRRGLLEQKERLSTTKNFKQVRSYER